MCVLLQIEETNTEKNEDIPYKNKDIPYKKKIYVIKNVLITCNLKINCKRESIEKRNIMKRNILQAPAVKILKLINELGGINERQIKRLIPNVTKESRFYYINSLKALYIEELEKGRFTSKTQKGIFSDAMEYCLWVLLDNIKEENGNEITYMRASKPNQITFIKNNCCYNVCYVDLNNISILEMLEQQYIEEKKERCEEMIVNYSIEPFKQIAVVQNEDIVEIIATMNLKMPITIACLNMDANGFANIMYLS